MLDQFASGVDSVSVESVGWTDLTMSRGSGPPFSYTRSPCLFVDNGAVSYHINWSMMF